MCYASIAIPSSDVINVYINAQLMILMVNANIIRVINHYVYILFFSPQRVEERLGAFCETMCDL